MAAKESTYLQQQPTSVADSRIFPAVEGVTTLTIAVPAGRYSASAIARAVEDCDANLLNLNVTTDGVMPRDYANAEVVVDLRVDLRHSMAVVRSLERYGFRVLSATADDYSATGEDTGLVEDTLRDRVNLLLRLLD